jgi:hypothetical protein
MPRRIGRPGLIGTMARTAVVAGTASAVSGSVAQGQRAKAQAAAAQQQAAIDQAVADRVATQPAAPPTVPPPAPQPATTQDPVIGELQRLAEMRQQGLLTDEEFTASKARLLGL